MKLAERLKEHLFLQWLVWQTRPARVYRELDNLFQKDKPTSALTWVKGRPHEETGQREERTQIGVAAVQGALKLVGRVEEYVRLMHRYTKEAVEGGAELVVFPEDNGVHLLGLLPGMGELDPALSMEEALEQMTGGEAKVADIFRYLAPVTNQVFHHTFSGLARQFGVYIMPGSVIIADEQGRMVNRAFLYDDTGRLVGSQTKTHLLPIEVSWGLSCGQEAKVFATPLGKLAFPVCMDASFYETFRLLTLLGAELILLPTANPEEYNHYKALRGIWPRVQENLVYGVKSALVGQAFGLILTGKAGIYAPMELTPEGDGIIKESSSHDREEVVVATLDLEALRRRRAGEDRQRFNVELYEKYFPQVYRDGRIAAKKD
jgi:predicted amidohydrolase